MYWILVGQTPIQCSEREWADYFRTHRNVLWKTDVGDYRVSTIFLGIDHGFGFAEVPVLFETMIFGPGGETQDFQARYRSWLEAWRGHKKACVWAGRR